MEASRIGELLRPFLAADLNRKQTADISIYVDILLRWNARVNLTAVRQPEEVVTRHFGESLFAAGALFPDPTAAVDVLDVGSGAGFPSIPIKLWAPAIRLTLVESSQRKVAFLREVCRAVRLMDVNVLACRAEIVPKASAAQIVTLRAVERFEKVLPVAAGLVAPGGRLALLIGERQSEAARSLLAEFSWAPALRIPLSTNRILEVGARPQ